MYTSKGTGVLMLKWKAFNGKSYRFKVTFGWVMATLQLDMVNLRKKFMCILEIHIC